MCEKRIIWPAMGEPDLVLSLGTGTSYNTTTTSKNVSSPIRDDYPHQLLHSFLQNIDGENIWREFINTLPDNVKDKYYRINITFEGPEPEIDDVFMMRNLKEQAEQWIKSDRHLHAVTTADSLLASLFYFELDDMLTYCKRYFECVGQILCQLHGSSSGLDGLTRCLMSTSATFLINGQSTTCFDSFNIFHSRFQQFRKKIQFTIFDINDMIDIAIRGLTM
jgi:hypothetical protein